MSTTGPQVTRAVPLPEGMCPSGPEELAGRTSARPGSFWLDAADAEKGSKAWSYVGWKAERVSSWREGSDGHEGPLPLDRLCDEMGKGRASGGTEGMAGAPPFRGGWFALLAYDLGRSIERLPDRAVGDLLFPDLYLAWHPVILAFNHRSERWWVAGTVEAGWPSDVWSSRLIARVGEWLAEAEFRRGAPGGVELRASCDVETNMARERYESAVRRALDYIAAGDIYQVNLSQRFEADWRVSAFELYRRLRRESPARYGVYARLDGERAVCSISPELFLCARGREVLTRPIKGTRRRGTTPVEDVSLRTELTRCAKERAELNMIVDLERNDLGRVCEFGTVHVVSEGELEEHPTVFHRVAGVAGRLREDVDAAALLRATFPGGSITGAPKIRAMEIIDELEPTRRGPYCGSLGWLGADGDLELSIAIRTALVDERAGKAWYQAGSGIVADSHPAHEYEETLHKAAAFLRAVR